MSAPFIASGNLLFRSDLTEAVLKHQLEAAVSAQVGKAVTVMLRTGAELAAVVGANPFADRPGNQVAAIFLDTAAPPSVLSEHRHRDGEEIALGTRELYVFYPHGMGQSRFVIPAATHGTARNLNTVAKLAVLAQTD